MKILLITDRMPPEQTTVGKIVESLAYGFKKEGNDVVILTSVRSRELEGASILNGIRIYNIFSNYHERWRSYLSLYNPQTVSKVRNIINKEKPDIVHCHNIHHFLSYEVLRLSKKSGAKVFLTAHDVMLFHYGKLVEFINPDNTQVPEKFDYRVSFWQQIKKYKKRYNPFRNFLIKGYLNHVDKIITVSAALKEALRQNGISNTVVVHNGIDLANWSTSNHKSVSEQRTILFGGRLSPSKGGHQAISILAKINKQSSNIKYRLVIMGQENSYSEEMRKLSHDLGVQDLLMFTGWLSGESLKAAYHSADALLVPSICFDSFPTVILEAFASGVGAFGTCYGGAREIIEPGQNGYVINPFDIDGTAKVIVEALSDPLKVESFGKKARERALIFSQENSVHLTLKVYNGDL